MNLYIILLCVYMYICVCVLERKGRKCRYCVSYLHCVCGALGQVRREREREASALIETNKDEVMVAVT